MEQETKDWKDNIFQGLFVCMYMFSVSVYTPSQATDWLRQYELCQDYLKRLTPTEYEVIIKNYTVSSTAIQVYASL